jgi:DNA-binding response OmpR family regulator
MTQRAKRVLVIDDERDIRELTKVCLETTSDWEVLVADSGQEGVEVATAAKPDIILLDAMMPDMDGVATFKKLSERRETSGIPVFMFTAKASEADRAEYASLGIRGVVTKPFDPLSLGAELEQLVSET